VLLFLWGTRFVKLFTILSERSDKFGRVEDVGDSVCVEPEVGGLLGHVSNEGQDGKSNCSRKARLTVAGQQTRTSYLRPGSRCWSRYQDSNPRGADLLGNWTGRRVGRMVCEGVKMSRRRSSRLGRT
jgi:hypothetical protein